MKIKLSDIVDNIESLKALQTVNFPVKVSYRLKRIIDKLNPIVKSYDEKRIELVKEYGEQDIDGNIKVSDPEKIKNFVAKIQDIQAIEEDVEFEKISISEVGDVQISPKDIVEFVFSE